MEKYKRVNPKITDLSAKEAVLVFSFLETLFEQQNLSVSFFNSKLNSYTIGQQYFILKYGKRYYNCDDPKSFIANILVRFEPDIDNEDEIQNYNAFEQLITYNSRLLVKRIDSIGKTVENRFKYHLKHNVPNEPIYDFELAISHKIPIYIRTKEFRQSFIVALEDLYSPDQIKELYNNSFHSSTQTFPPKLLYLEMENSTALYNAMYSIFKERFKFISENLNSLNSKYDHRVSKKTAKRRKSYSKLETKKVTRYDFMCIMYNAFPKIRDSFSKAKASNPSLVLEDYLKTKSRNIRA